MANGKAAPKEEYGRVQYVGKGFDKRTGMRWRWQGIHRKKEIPTIIQEALSKDWLTHAEEIPMKESKKRGPRVVFVVCRQNGKGDEYIQKFHYPTDRLPDVPLESGPGELFVEFGPDRKTAFEWLDENAAKFMADHHEHCFVIDGPEISKNPWGSQTSSEDDINE
jgi:hypothetical protein